jgi:hypothetical protein
MLFARDPKSRGAQSRLEKCLYVWLDNYFTSACTGACFSFERTTFSGKARLRILIAILLNWDKDLEKFYSTCQPQMEKGKEHDTCLVFHLATLVVLHYRFPRSRDFRGQCLKSRRDVNVRRVGKVGMRRAHPLAAPCNFFVDERIMPSNQILITSRTLCFP